MQEWRAMGGDRFFYVMIVVIALIGVGLFAIPVRAGDLGRAMATAATALDARAYLSGA
jgi:hypothetical protein